MKLNINKKNMIAMIKFEVEVKEKERVITLFKQRKKELEKILKEFSLYKERNSNLYIILFQIENFEIIDNILNEYDFFEKDLSKVINSDYHWNIVGYVESVKERVSSIPRSEYMQLRHIEVPLKNIDSYLKWRRKTIFKYVKNNKEVKSFEVFHSLVSGVPGVWFISEVNGDVVNYERSFNTQEYKEIIKEAGDSHIKNKLSTIIYKLIDLGE